MQLPDFYVVSYDPYGGELIYTPTGVGADKKSQDFYWTGAIRMGFDGGVPFDFSYAGTWHSSMDIHSGDLVDYRDDSLATSTYFPEKQFFYCVKDLPPSTPPADNDGYFMKANVKSFIYKGNSREPIPEAYHAYDINKGIASHRYEEGSMPTAEAAEMGETHVKISRDVWHTYFNEENNPDQFYIAQTEHFNIYETCHGTRPLFYMGASGNFNFYNATYPAGYYAPPFGEVPSLTLVGSTSEDATINALTSTDSELLNFNIGGCCKELTDKETLEMWGIRTVFPKGDSAMVTFDHKRGDEHGIHAPYEECPPDLPPTIYFQQENFGYHPGSIMAPGAGTYYNDNPFPNSLDINGWYGAHVYETQRCWMPGGVIVNGYKLKAGFPEMTYPTSGSNDNKLNAGICQARLCETSQLMGYNFQGVQGGMATGPGGAVNDQASFATYDPFVYWHFIFRYNHDQLWNKTENTLSNNVTSFSYSEGITEEHLWEYRQCPSTPDFLPWSSDIPIHACPNDYFDIPYYSAMGRFGFYGARFFNSCSTPISTAGTETQEDTERDFNYYEAVECSNRGQSLVGKIKTMKAVADRSDAGSQFLRINGKCYDVTFIETSSEDKPVDFVLSSTSPGWQDQIISVPLKYNVYEHGGLLSLDPLKLVNTITWDTVSLTVSACESCVDGAIAGLDQAREEITQKIEAKFGKSLSEIRQMMAGVNGRYCDQSPACDPYLQHGSVAFNPYVSIDEPFQHLNDKAREYAMRAGADDIHASEGGYSTFDSKVDIVRDYSAGVQDCDSYAEPQVQGGTCEEDHYETLLEIAKNEQRLGEFFAGNMGFFLWANYDHVVNSHEYKNELTGLTPGADGETHFKQSLYRLKRDFDQILLSLPNLLEGLDDPVIYYESASNGMFGNAPLNYSRQGLWSDMLFNNNRYRQFMKELEWDVTQHIFSNSKKHTAAWNKILDNFGYHIATNNGGVEHTFYQKAIEGKEKRLLTRFVENKLRGKAIDLFPTNQPSFSWDSTSPYISGSAWGNSSWGNSVVGEGRSKKGGTAQFAPLPTGVRNYFHGVYSRKTNVTGLADKISSARSQGGTHYYAGLYQDFSCGGDTPLAVHNAGGIAVDVSHKNIPASPWKTAGHDGIGRVNDNFSCFSPIYIQDAQDITCKIGQRPTFRVQAVDYHTIPEDKIGKGYPEIDFWTNNLKLTNSKGEAKYPIGYKWYRVSAIEIDRFDPNTELDHLFYANSPVLQEASVTGEWACLEGVSGVGNEDCTMFHPQASYTHDQVEDYKNGRDKWGYDHWNKLVDYNGLTHHVNSWKKQGDHRLWRTWAYLQGAYTELGRQESMMSRDEDDALYVTDISAIPTFGDAGSSWQGYDDMMFHKYGVDNDRGDDDYYYFCVASGRFGFRRSEYASLVIEDWLKVDFSIRNGAPVSIPMPSIAFSWSRVDEEQTNELPDSMYDAYFRPSQGVLETAENLVYDSQGKASDGGKYLGRAYRTILNKGFGSHKDSPGDYQSQSTPIGPFWGLQRDANQVWENEILEKINMHNNCRSFAFIGKEGYRGTTRTFKPPTQHNIKGDQSEYHGWFEYGLLVPYGAKITQTDGNGIYGGSQLPVCRNYESPVGARGVGFNASIALNLAGSTPTTLYEVTEDRCGNTQMTSRQTSLIEEISRTNLGTQGTDSTQGTPDLDVNDLKARGSEPRMSHFIVHEPAFLSTNSRDGVKPTQMMHHGELYSYAEQDTYYNYAITTPGEGRGVTWQFSHNLGAIKRFGYYHKPNDPTPRVNWTTVTNAVLGEPRIPMEIKDDEDVIWWGGYEPEQRREYNAAKRMIFANSLAGENCGWRTESCGRFMLYFVEALQRYWISCEGKKKIRNKSFIAPGLRHGSSAVQYFWGGYPSNTYVKRKALPGPYAYEWKVHQHNRDRNGNGFSAAFYSSKFERPMQLYDPPSIYGLWARQTDSNDTLPSIERLRKLRSRAQGPAVQGSRKVHPLPVNIKGMFFGPYGTANNGGCGSYRIGCIEQLHRPSRSWRYYPGDPICDWYKYAFHLGPDQGWHYGCSEKQLLLGTCFDPCLSLKYNYGFFPGGKLLTVNNYVKYKESRHDTQTPEGASAGILAGTAAVQAESETSKPADGSSFITQLTGDVDDEETAITKYKAVKFVRLARGPWATPYRRIKTQIALDAGIPNPSTSDVLNKDAKMDKTFLGSAYTHEGLHHGRYAQKTPTSTKLYAEKRSTNTTVSPCNTNGADHCQYLTPTMHLGMDVEIEFMMDVFGKTATILGGGYTKSEEITVADEFRRQMGGFAMFLVNMMPSTIAFTAAMKAATSLLEMVQAIRAHGMAMTMKDLIKSFFKYTEDSCPGGANGNYWDAFTGMLGDAFSFLGLNPDTTTLLEEEIATRAANSQGNLQRESALAGLRLLDNQGLLINI